MTPVKIAYDRANAQTEISWGPKTIALPDSEEVSRPISVLVDQLKSISRGDGEGGLSSDDLWAIELFEQIADLKEADAPVE